MMGLDFVLGGNKTLKEGIECKTDPMEQLE